MISDDHIPQIPLDHHDSIFKLPCGGKESPKGIRNRSHPGVSSIWDGVHEWCGRLAFQSRPTGITFSRCHDRHDPTSVMANGGHWMLLHSIEVLGTCKLHICNICKICEFADQWMISWWSVDDLRGTVELSEAATEGISEGLWANSGAVVLAGSSEIPPLLATKSQRLSLKKYALLIQTKKFFLMPT